MQFHFLRIDKEFASICPVHTEEELVQLDESLLADGCRDPILYWANHDGESNGSPIIDGHTRYDRCRELNIEYTVRGLEFPSRSAVLKWIVRNQLGRRNLSEGQKQALRVILYREIEREHQEKYKEEHPEEEAEPPRIPTTKLASNVGVAERTVRRDKASDKGMALLAEVSPKLFNEAKSGHIAVQEAARLHDAPKEALRELERIARDSPVDLRAAVKNTLSVNLIRRDGPAPRTGHAPVAKRELQALEDAYGKLVRAKSAALIACGGRTTFWANEHAEAIRQLMIGIYEHIFQWQEAAAKEAGVAWQRPVPASQNGSQSTTTGK